MQTGEPATGSPITAKLIVGVGFLLLMAVVFVAAAVVNRGDGVVLAFCVAAALLFLALSFRQFRQVVPKRLRGVTVAVSEFDVWRGEAVDVRFELTGGTADEGLEVGLVCMEYWEDKTVGQGGGNRTIITKNEPAHEEWRPVRAASGAQTERFTVPVGAPFSFRGKALSFVWSAKVRHKSAVVEAPLVVHP